jgi:hypothetical protein
MNFAIIIGICRYIRRQHLARIGLHQPRFGCTRGHRQCGQDGESQSKPPNSLSAGRMSGHPGFFPFILSYAKKRPSCDHQLNLNCNQNVPSNQLMGER